MIADKREGADATPYSAVVGVVRPGEWTTYGDISAAVHAGSKRRARAVARAAASEPGFPNAHRVLAHNGRVVRGAGGEGQKRRAQARLRAEGVSIDNSGRADPTRRVHWDELQRRGVGIARRAPGG